MVVSRSSQLRLVVAQPSTASDEPISQIVAETGTTSYTVKAEASPGATRAQAMTAVRTSLLFISLPLISKM